MAPESLRCTCTSEGYSPDCPKAFMQGGQLLHVLDGEVSLKPRIYQPPSSSSNGSESYDQIDPFLEGSEQGSPSSADGLRRPTSIAPLQLNRLNGSGHLGKANGLRTFAGEVHLQPQYDDGLKKFDALTVNGQTITDYTIGGYGSDVRLMRETLEKFVPLPPVALPLIFLDKDLNFLHHFFQGLEILLGRSYLHGMATDLRYSDDDRKTLLPSIKKLVLSGHKETDTELTIFVKRVLSATFKGTEATPVASQGEHLLVIANLWGFQYIEGGMKIDNNELRMWLNSNYSTYKISWFNAFKSSGVPIFAIDGAQNRFEARGDRQYAREKPSVEISEEREHRHHSSSRSSKSHKHRGNGKEVASKRTLFSGMRA